MNLSPLNFSGLIAMANMPLGALPESHPAHISRRAIECWKCPDCDEVYDDESDAIDCCGEASDSPCVRVAEAAGLCPVCASHNPSHRDAADCCLWKDFDAYTRWAMADRVEAGETWTQVLGIH